MPQTYVPVQSVRRAMYIHNQRPKREYISPLLLFLPPLLPATVHTIHHPHPRLIPQNDKAALLQLTRPAAAMATDRPTHTRKTPSRAEKAAKPSILLFFALLHPSPSPFLRGKQLGSSLDGPRKEGRKRAVVTLRQKKASSLLLLPFQTLRSDFFFPAPERQEGKRFADSDESFEIEGPYISVNRRSHFFLLQDISLENGKPTRPKPKSPPSSS